MLTAAEAMGEEKPAQGRGICRSSYSQAACRQEQCATCPGRPGESITKACMPHDAVGAGCCYRALLSSVMADAIGLCCCRAPATLEQPIECPTEQQPSFDPPRQPLGRSSTYLTRSLTMGSMGACCIVSAGPALESSFQINPSSDKTQVLRTKPPPFNTTTYHGRLVQPTHSLQSSWPME